MAGREVVTVSSNHFLHAPRPWDGIVRNVAVGIAVGGLLIAGDVRYNGWNPARLPWFCIIGIGMAIFGWGSDRLWDVTIAQMMDKPFTWYAYLSRVPFWFMAGGIAYTVGMLMVKNISPIVVYAYPVRKIFLTGGECGIAIQGGLSVLEAIRRRRTKSAECKTQSGT